MTRCPFDLHAEWMLAVEETTEASTAGQITLIVFIIGGVIYGFGYARAVMHRANKDYKATKAAVPGLRKGFWAAWWAAVKVGFWVLVAGSILIVWMVRSDDRPADAGTTPTPSPSVSRKG